MYVNKNDFSSPLLKKYKLKESKSTNDINDKGRNIKDLYEIMFSKSKDLNSKIKQFNKQKSSKNIKNLNDEFIQEKETDNINNEQDDNTKTTDNDLKLKERRYKRFKTEKKFFTGIISKNSEKY